MAYVITAACVDVKDTACLDVCPVDCIYTGGRMLYIQPDECINCSLCVSVCPVEAIYADDAIPEDQKRYTAINAEFFDPQVTGWGSPGGAGPHCTTDADHPAVAALPPQSPAV
ncbi:MAG: ferredoxin family protein [Alphaproteobacteria bacterium]|nr:ferredoxin family protein [Alphaproteobacteria bacterium]